MTDDTEPAWEADSQNVTEGDSENSVLNSSGHESEKPASEGGAAETKPIRIAIARLGHVLSEEETAEEDRRWKAIKSNRHPDTGDRLKPGDEKALRPVERAWLKMQRATQMQLRMIDDARARYQMAETFERARTMNLWSYNTPAEGAINHCLGRQIDQITRSDIDRARERMERSQVFGSIVDADLAALGHRRDYGQLAETELRRSFLEPLFDPPFVNRITGGSSAELMYRATVRQDQEAIRALGDQVNHAATGLITEFWRDPGQLYRGTTATEFRFDSILMQTEAQRLLSIYGPRIVDQTGFLTEQHRNLELFVPHLTATSFERADLLARIALPPTFLSDFTEYDLANVKALERFADSAVAQLEADFSKTKNPVLAWEAFTIARNYGLEVPDWVLDVVKSAADGITALRAEVEDGAPLGKEAEVVGRALGFGNRGRGGTGLFAEASQLSRDRETYFAIAEWLEAERIRQPNRKLKLTSAYSEVAAQLNSNPSTVRQAYRRMKEFIGTEEEFED